MFAVETLYSTMCLATILSLLAIEVQGNQCSKGDIKCGSEDTDHYAVTRIFDTAIHYSTNLEHFKKLDNLLKRVMSMQSHQEDFLPKRTSYDKAIANIEAWAKKRYYIDGVTAKVVPGLGASVFATKDMKSGHTVGNISARYVLSTQQTRDDYKCLGEVMYAGARRPGLWGVGSLALLLLRHAYDKESEFRTFIDSLPMTIKHPVFFTYKEMVALEKSVVLKQSLNDVYEMAAIYASIYQRLSTNPECCEKIGVPLEKFTLRAFRYAFAMALTRNYDGSFDSEQVNRVMIPFWDLFNHNPQPHLETSNKLENPPGCYVSYAVGSIKSGEQIFMHYRDSLGPVQAFTIWGFVEVNEITLDFVTANLTDFQKALLADMSWFDEGEFTFQDPDNGGNVVEPEIVADVVDIISTKRHAIPAPRALYAAWKLILAQVNYQLSLYAHPVEKYRKMLTSDAVLPNLRLVYQQLVAEIEILSRITNYITNDIPEMATSEFFND